MRRFRRKRRMDVISEVNVTPLIDLAFALLIIFMITTPLLEQSIDLNLPVEGAKESVSKEEQKVQVISVSKEGDYFWGKEKIKIEDMKMKLSGMAGSEDTIFHIRADAATSYQNVVTVLDLLKLNNLSQISLDTQVQ